MEEARKIQQRFSHGAAVLAVVLGSLLSSGVRAEAPVSGYIQTVTYAVNKEGNPVGQKRYERIWFSGRNTRRESLIGDNLATAMVTGDTFWVAMPAAGRILVRARPDKGALSVPETARQGFDYFCSAHPTVGNSVWNGHPCWKYSWHEPARQSGDIRSDAYDVTEWVLADKAFPFILRSETSAGARSEAVDFQLNCPVPETRFKQPAGFAPVTATGLPKTQFKIAVETHRVSLRYGWKSQAREVFTGDGKQVTIEYHSTQTEADGRRVPFDAPKRALTYEMARIEIFNRLQTPSWLAVKKTGPETVMGLPADVLKGTVEGLPDQKWWIVNHPLLGTVTLRRESRSAEEQEAVRVTELTISK